MPPPTFQELIAAEVLEEARDWGMRSLPTEGWGAQVFFGMAFDDPVAITSWLAESGSGTVEIRSAARARRNARRRMAPTGPTRDRDLRWYFAATLPADPLVQTARLLIDVAR